MNLTGPFLCCKAVLPYMFGGQDAWKMSHANPVQQIIALIHAVPPPRLRTGPIAAVQVVMHDTEIVIGGVRA